MKRVYRLMGLAALIFLCLGAGASFSGKVVRVSSGDRLTVLHDLNPEVVVLYGVACPGKDQPFAVEAEQFISGVATGHTVTVMIRDRDFYNRTMADVILSDGRNLVYGLLLNGLAWWDQPNFPEDQELQRLEAEARAARRGLWANPNPVPPWEWGNAVHVHLVTISSSPNPVQPPNAPPPQYQPQNRPPNQPANYSRPNNQPGSQGKPVDVRGYTRKDGTSVRPHKRGLPPRPQ